MGAGYVPSCPSQKFVKKGKETKEEEGVVVVEEEEGGAHLLPRGDQVLVGFEDVSQSLLDVFLLHAGQHSWRQEQRQTPLLPAGAEDWNEPCVANCLHCLLKAKLDTAHNKDQVKGRILS